MYCSQISGWVAHRYGHPFALLINIMVPSSCFLSRIAFWGAEIILFSGVCQSGGCIIHAGGGGGFTHRLTDCLMCNRRRPAATSSRRASFSALASANSFVVLHRACNTTLMTCMSVIAAFASFNFHIFVALGFVGNGVITVMINSPWQADDDADNQSGDNRGDLPATSTSDRSGPLLWILQSGCQSLCSNWP